MERADQIVWLLGSGALSPAVALGVSRRPGGRPALLTALLAAGLGTGVLAASAWVAEAGGKVRHSEIRGKSVPPTDTDNS